MKARKRPVRHVRLVRRVRLERLKAYQSSNVIVEAKIWVWKQEKDK